MEDIFQDSTEATVKTKKCSLGDVGVKYFAPLQRYLMEFYNLKDFEKVGTKLFVFSNLDLKNKEFVMGKKIYLFVSRDNKYEVCKLIKNNR